MSTAWRQADALKDASIEETWALQPLLKAIDAGEFQPTEKTVLIIDEISQIAASNDLVGCGHMSGLSMRSICPLALMESDDQDPYHVNALYARGAWRAVPNLRWRPCRSYVDAPPWQALFLRFERFGRLRSYIRPVDAEHMSAGLDGVRRSGSLSCERALRSWGVAGCP